MQDGTPAEPSPWSRPTEPGSEPPAGGSPAGATPAASGSPTDRMPAGGEATGDGTPAGDRSPSDGMPAPSEPPLGAMPAGAGSEAPPASDEVPAGSGPTSGGMPVGGEPTGDWASGGGSPSSAVPVASGSPGDGMPAGGAMPAGDGAPVDGIPAPSEPTGGAMTVGGGTPGVSAGGVGAAGSSLPSLGGLPPGAPGPAGGGAPPPVPGMPPVPVPGMPPGQAAVPEPYAPQPFPGAPVPPQGPPPPGTSWEQGAPWAPGSPAVSGMPAQPGLPVGPGPSPGRPPAPPRYRDRLAGAVGNASLLGVGYVLLGRRGLAVLADAVTLVLVLLSVTALRTGWFEIVLVVWWLAQIAHGWYLGGGDAPRTGVLRQRLIAACFALPVLLAVGLLRFDAQTIDGALSDARASGDCTAARAALSRIGFGDRLADAPLTARGDQTGAACRRIDDAASTLRRALRSGDTTLLSSGFAGLAGVLTELPGHAKMVDRALTSFLGALPTHDACHTAAVTDWLRARKPDHTLLDRAGTVVPRVAPAALLGCGDAQLDGGRWAPAKKRYQQLLKQYPDDSRAGRARAGVAKADKAIRLDHVNSLLNASGANGWPEYCRAPEKYVDATRYRKGTNPGMFFGGDDYTGKLPSSWRTDDTTKAALIVCVGTEKRGSATRTCPYQSNERPGASIDVTFYKIALPVQVYELRTGRKIADRTVQIGGSSCPQVINYTTTEPYYNSDPSTKQPVDPSSSDIRAAFRSLIVH